MGKYADNNSIDEYGGETRESDIDEEQTDVTGPDQPDYAFEIEEEDLAWDLPDSGDAPELDDAEAAAWEAGTLALLDEPHDRTDRYDADEPSYDEEYHDHSGYPDDEMPDRDADEASYAEEYHDHSGYPDDEMPDRDADEAPYAEEYHDHSGYPDDEMPDRDADEAPYAEEYYDQSGYPDDEIPNSIEEIYTEELPPLDALLDELQDTTSIDTEMIRRIDEDPDDDAYGAVTDVIRIIDDGTPTGTAAIEIRDEDITTDTDIIEIDDDIASDTDVIQIIDEGVPSVTDLIPIIDAGELAETDALEIPTAPAETARHAADEADTVAGETAVETSVGRQRTALDYAIWVAGAAVVILASIAGIRFQQALEVRAEATQYQQLGSAIAGIGTIGEDQIAAIKAERVQKDADRKVAEQKAAEKAELAANEGTIPVTMSLSSVEKDLKIKIHGENGSLISGVPFKVRAILPSGKTAEYEDDDQDGIIYQSGLTAGTYKVVLEQLVADAADGADVTETDDYKNYSQYKIPTDAQTVEVKDKIVYAAIDVSDEIKTTAQVNVAAEDTQQKLATESELQDTVEFVESTATTTAEEDALYETVDKSEIVDPNVSARAGLVIGDFRMLAEDSDDDSEEDSENGSTEAAAISEDDDSDNQGDDHQDSDSKDNNDDQNSDDQSDDGDDDGDSKRTYTTTIKGSTSVAVGGTTLITASTDEPGATTYTWELEGDAISIDRTDGKTVTVTGNAEGSATLKATAHLVAEDADPTENVVSTTITVTAAEETSDKRLVVSPSSVTLVAGKTQALSVSLEGVDDDGVSYESAESMIAEVSDDGTITAHTVGETTITVTADADSSLKQSVKVKVVETETNEDGNTLLKDKNGNQIYVKDGGAYREATAADYDAFETFYRKIEGKATASEFKYTGWQNIGGKTYYFNSAGEPVTGNQVINGASYTFGADGALTSGTSKVGIDVSQWNGSISWSQVASSGISYAIVRCGYRGSSTGALIKDPSYATNMAGATAAGLKVGLYVFSQAVNEVEAVEEASMAIAMASSYGVSLPIFIDVEAAGGRADSLSTSQRTAVVSAFCQTVQASGYSAGVYSNTNWLSECLNTPALTSYHIWVAQYAASLSYSRTRYDIWQYSSKGRVAGISGDVDMNMSYRSY